MVTQHARFEVVTRFEVVKVMVLGDVIGKPISDAEAGVGGLLFGF